jgi:putative alpha-1,2-mannosidase
MLVQKSGGNEAFLKRLNTFFDNGFYNVGNEPSFLSPNLYHWIGRPDLSSDRIHQIIDKHYNSGRKGIPGNDDSGAMSSWLAFHMIGLYPNAGQPYYLIDTPYFKETVIHLENGNNFSILAPGLSEKSRYIQSATLNGKPFKLSWIEHRDIESGGILILDMGPVPLDWGVGVSPPSKSDRLKN